MVTDSIVVTVHTTWLTSMRIHIPRVLGAGSLRAQSCQKISSELCEKDWFQRILLGSGWRCAFMSVQIFSFVTSVMLNLETHNGLPFALRRPTKLEESGQQLIPWGSKEELETIKNMTTGAFLYKGSRIKRKTLNTPLYFPALALVISGNLFDLADLQVHAYEVRRLLQFWVLNPWIVHASQVLYHWAIVLSMDPGILAAP